eukprot:1875885-Rhodomonas_salina.1
MINSATCLRACYEMTDTDRVKSAIWYEMAGTDTVYSTPCLRTQYVWYCQMLPVRIITVLPVTYRTEVPRQDWKQLPVTCGVVPVLRGSH